MPSPISIIIPTYNRLGMVLRALDSVLNQSYNNFEVIVVDDGSTDRTADCISRYHDSRIRYVYQDHKGVSVARNLGVRQACGDWICFLDSDDVWRRHKLGEQIQFHFSHPNCFISQTDDVWIRNSKTVNKKKIHTIREGDIFHQSLRLCLLCCSSVMMRKSLFLEQGGFDESLKTCEDYDLWLRVLVQHPVGFVKKKLVTKFGGHADQLSKAYPMMDEYRVRTLEKLLRCYSLSDNQKTQVEEELRYKKMILQKGREKRI